MGLADCTGRRPLQMAGMCLLGTPHPAEAQGWGAGGACPADDRSSLFRPRGPEREATCPRPPSQWERGGGIPALSRAPRAQHPLTWVGSPGARYQEPASWASPRLEPLRSQHPSLLITPHSPPAGTCLPTPTLRREGVPMAPRPPHTLSSLAAHLPQPVSSRCCHTQQGLSTASQARCGGSH